MGPQTRSVERRSQATPFAEDTLRVLQGELDRGAFGAGVGPLQRESGTAIRQFLSGLQQRQADIGGRGSSRLLDALQARNTENVNRQALDLREAFGASGARFGSQLGGAEAQLRRGAATDFAVTAADLLFGEQQALDQLLLGTAATQFGLGTESMAPFLQLAQLGILPEEIIASPGVLDQLIGAGANAGAAALTGGTSLALPALASVGASFAAPRVSGLSADPRLFSTGPGPAIGRFSRPQQTSVNRIDARLFS